MCRALSPQGITSRHTFQHFIRSIRPLTIRQSQGAHKMHTVCNVTECLFMIKQQSSRNVLPSFSSIKTAFVTLHTYALCALATQLSSLNCTSAHAHNAHARTACPDVYAFAYWSTAPLRRGRWCRSRIGCSSAWGTAVDMGRLALVLRHERRVARASRHLAAAETAGDDLLRYTRMFVFVSVCVSVSVCACVCCIGSRKRVNNRY